MVKIKFFKLRNYLFFLFVCFAFANVEAQTEEGNNESIENEDQYYQESEREDYLEDEDIEEDEEDESIYLNLLSFHLTIQTPLETFAKNVDDSSLGFGISYYNNFSKKDDLFWAIHISNFKIDRLTNQFFVPGNPDGFDLNLKTKSSLIFLGYGTRFYPDIYTPSWEPFLELKLGGNFVYTYTSETVNDSEDADFRFENFDFSIAYAVGLGVQYNIREGQALHFTAFYNGGSNTTYLVNDELGFDEPIDNFVRRTTQLDYLQIAIGFTAGF